MKRNHHRPLYQVWVCKALVFESRDFTVAHEYARLAKRAPDDTQVVERTIYRNSGILLNN